MTTIYLAGAGGQYIVKAKGHATGSEQVCAGISAILYSLAGYLHNEMSITTTEYKMDDGDVFLKFSGQKEARIAFEITSIGLKQIVMTYPEYAEIVPKMGAK